MNYLLSGVNPFIMLANLLQIVQAWGSSTPIPLVASGPISSTFLSCTKLTNFG